MPVQIENLLLAGTEGTSREIAHRAGRLAFPDAEIVALAGVEDTLKRIEKPGQGLLIMTSPEFREVKATMKALNGGAARWGVVILGTEMEGEGFETVPSEGWEVRNLARVFQAAAERHQLRSENARLRGDLQTIAGRICHDLRTPLNGIFAAAEALKEGEESDLSAGVTLTDALFGSADELAKLIERVSFVLKASARPRPKERILMADPVCAALTRLESRILRQGAVITQPAVWPEVCGVAGWLETIWWNLISNALIHGGGPIQIELGWHEDASQWFWVRDNGRGVAQHKRATLFHPFDRLHEPGAAQGLGLPIIRRLAELQGGHCRYEAVAEEGACFLFALPSPLAPEPGARD